LINFLGFTTPIVNRSLKDVLMF